MTARIGYRDDLQAAVNYTAATSANSATGFVDTRIDAKYLRAEITVTGNFKKHTGFSFKSKPSGKR